MTLHLPDVARPAVQRHDGHVADDLAVLDGDGPSRARACPRVEHARGLDVLLEERPVPLGDALHEALDGVAVRRPAAP